VPKKKKKTVPPAADRPSAGTPEGGATDTTPAVLPQDPRVLLRNRLIFLAIAIMGAVSDVISKYVVFGLLDVSIESRKGFLFAVSEEEIRIFGETLKLKAALNQGAVFGMFQGKWLFLVIFTLVALGIIGWVLFRSRNLHAGLASGLGLVCAGALGNLWDRFLFSAVRDFILFTSPLLEPFIRGGQWPTFNVADIWICVGIPLILLGDYLGSRSLATPAEAPPVEKGSRADFPA